MSRLDKSSNYNYSLWQNAEDESRVLSLWKEAYFVSPLLHCGSYILHLTDRHITSSLFLIAVFKKNKRRKIASRRSRVFHSLALQNTLFRSLGNNLAFFASPVNSYQSQCFFLFCFFLMYFQLNAWYEVYVEHKHHTLQLSTHA